MNYKKYIKRLEQSQIYCECESLANLREKARKTEKLEKICDKFSSPVDANSARNIDDKTHLQKYLQRAKEFEKAVKNYEESLIKNLDKGNLSLYLHEKKDDWTKSLIKNIPISIKSKTIISFNCSYCDTLIDFISE
ncbi:MAG: hypothetical protein KJ646_06115 [Nanoarchaeota archaeon]|nr:hypothetical protein [Nanoarchaeota archaeon]MBU4117022.1 hypothetical protein [Nanoarchaeota archaeon]